MVFPAKSRATALFLVSLIVVPLSGDAFEYSLQPTAVREAYFLGRTTETGKLEQFLQPYIHRFPVPAKGPHVESIEFQTPYEQEVMKSRNRLANYSAQDAQMEYQVQPDLVVVRILVLSTPSYPGLTIRPANKDGVWQPDDFLRGFEFRVEQKSLVKPKELKKEFVCAGSDKCPYAFGGCEVQLEFDAAQFAQGPVKVLVVTHDYETVEAEFDLDKLK